jgi:hypothetical protein
MFEGGLGTEQHSWPGSRSGKLVEETRVVKSAFDPGSYES